MAGFDSAFQWDPSSKELFESARKSLDSIVVAAGGKGDFTQDQLVDLLAGPAQSSPDGVRVHQEIARRMHAVLDDQRLVPLDTLFGLYDGLGQMAHGDAIGDSLLPLAGALREFELPRPIFTSGERVSWSPTVYVSRHAELQVRTDLTKVIKTPGTPAQLEAARERLAPFLRDTLVGLNYAYFEPPGSQVLHSNPLFVRAHDFAASSIQGIKRRLGTAQFDRHRGHGWRRSLSHWLARRPALRTCLTEEDFISPEKLQALIWKETVPQAAGEFRPAKVVEREPGRAARRRSLSALGRGAIDGIRRQRRSAPKSTDSLLWPLELGPT